MVSLTPVECCQFIPNKDPAPQTISPADLSFERSFFMSLHALQPPFHRIMNIMVCNGKWRLNMFPLMVAGWADAQPSRNLLPVLSSASPHPLSGMEHWGRPGFYQQAPNAVIQKVVACLQYSANVSLTYVCTDGRTDGWTGGGHLSGNTVKYHQLHQTGNVRSLVRNIFTSERPRGRPL